MIKFDKILVNLFFKFLKPSGFTKKDELILV